MTRLIITNQAAADIERLGEFLLESMPHEAIKTSDIVFDGLEVLAAHPGIGRPVGGNMRELVISRGRSGYLALYAYDDVADMVSVLAVRHQRESGYAE
ncbi:type II toxin-antitoxin system RelE/ParE family toxin [Ramlibacter sp. WS9]|uniref:type II toxin-antitoxin system RelE/ParE family toxin n=1 Tax=Ramlibacter sp. WS9 TaxID=1882741 RepID=UPI0018EE63A7|nr:type II toxin-antitoxin system RelE/ParE family toxin [Ramlibacter sp. WS9]